MTGAPRPAPGSAPSAPTINLPSKATTGVGSSKTTRRFAIFDYQQVFHVGVRVPAVEPAMAELQEGLGLRWSSIQERELQLWLPGAGMIPLSLRFTYSAGGPQHVELIQATPGSIWDGNDLPGLHHMGVWADDVGKETERLIQAGWVLEVAQLSPEDGYGAFTHVRSPHGFLVEPVGSWLQPMYERWWAGGAFR